MKPDYHFSVMYLLSEWGSTNNIALYPDRIGNAASQVHKKHANEQANTYICVHGSKSSKSKKKTYNPNNLLYKILKPKTVGQNGKDMFPSQAPLPSVPVYITCDPLLHINLMNYQSISSVLPIATNMKWSSQLWSDIWLAA